METCLRADLRNWQEVLNLEVDTYQTEAGNQLKGFLSNKVRRSGPQYLFDGAQELTVLANQLVSNPDHSLALLVYAGLHPETVKLGPMFQSVVGSEVHSGTFTPDPGTFFQGSNLVLPKNQALDSRFKSFEQWTGVNEVKHISLWLLAALRSLYGSDLQSALEVEIPLPGEARSGRLDVVAIQSDKLICFEAKTSINDAIKDRRFVEQVPKYKKQILQTCQELGLAELHASVILTTGGSESDLKCVNATLRPTTVGQKLLEVCYQHGIRFITANAVWQILVSKLLPTGQVYDLTSALEILASSNGILGLTSAGFIMQDMSLEPWRGH